MKLIIQYLHGRSRTVLVLMGLVLVIYIGELDYVTGPMVALMVFYLIPVCFVSWFAGRWPGILIAFVSSLIWYAAKYLDPGSIDKHWLLLWNTVQRFSLFSLLAVLTSEVTERKRIEQALRAAQEGLETRVRQRTEELALANEAMRAEVLERTQAQEKLRALNETLEQRVAERSAAAEERALELVRSETALRRQTSILQSILNSMGDGVIVADASRKILLSNPAAQSLMRAGLGLGDTEDFSEQFKAYLSDALTTHPHNQHPLIRAIHGEVIDSAEFFLRQPDSMEGIWIAATGRPLIDERGQIQGGVVVYRDMTARKQLEKQVAEISDREQRRIGQDLHDSLCQHLVSIAFASELLRDKLERDRLPEAARAEIIAEMVNEGISQARNLARGLYPVRLEVDGLASALEELAVAVQARNNITCHFTAEERVLIYDEVAGNNLFRIVQESVNNAVKHSRCKNISIGLGAVDDEVILTIKDDGIGFPANRSSTGMGLSIMNYRAKMIDASLEIRRGVGGGTIVLCSFHNKNLAATREPAITAKPVETR